MDMVISESINDFLCPKLKKIANINWLTVPSS